MIVLLTLRHGLHRTGWRVHGSRLPHPVLLAAIAGAVFWVGNTGIILGRKQGLTLWIRQGVSAAINWATGGQAVGGGSELVSETAWEEMATFHLFGVLGNDWLWRGYEWVALAEIRAQGAAARRTDALCSAHPPAAHAAHTAHAAHAAADDQVPGRLRHRRSASARRLSGERGTHGGTHGGTTPVLRSSALHAAMQSGETLLADGGGLLDHLDDAGVSFPSDSDSLPDSDAAPEDERDRESDGSSGGRGASPVEAVPVVAGGVRVGLNGPFAHAGSLKVANAARGAAGAGLPIGLPADWLRLHIDASLASAGGGGGRRLHID